jgi:hypothetical protein
MTPVTDPAILAQLNSDGAGKPISDPALLQQLNSAEPSNSQALGYEQAVGNFLANAAQPGVWLGKKLGLDMSQFEQGQHLLRNPAHDANVQPGGVGKFVGSLPGYVGTSFLGPVGSGLIGGALNSEAGTPLGVAADAGLSAAGGKATDLLLKGASKVIAPQLKPAVQKLMDAKIPLTPGQTLGGTAKTIEDKLTSWPIVGSMIGNAQRNSVNGFNKAVLNSALEPIGKTLPPGMEAGREAVDHVADTIGKQYDLILPKMSGAIDQQFQSDLGNIGQNAIGSGAKQDTLDRFKNILQAQIIDRADPTTGQLSGEALKAAQQNLGAIGRKMAASQDADTQQLGDLVMDAHGAFNDMLARNNPGYAGDLAAANKAYAQYVRIRKAAGALGSKDGMFSAPQYANAVKASDSSAGRGNYARGKAFMQDLSDPANQVLPSTVPDSGTAGRGLMAAMLTGGIPLLPKVAVPAAAIAGLYTQPGQTAARYVLGGSRPAWAPAAANAVNNSRIPLSILASGLPRLVTPQN